ncbi:ABC transporter permease subunit [Novosphingobium rosa]|uniref:ABC transporter permease subunit n=1 Tax=Novosphingobium rosa TaxID=76978 RepID=UPI000835456E|nr:ABC transporter permease subunit [Novosphingobium rosa]
MMRAEALLMLRNRALCLMLAVLAALLLGTGLTTLRDHALTAQTFAQTGQAERDRWLHQSAKTPHRAAHFGLWVFRAPAPLSALDPGTDPFVGRMLRVEAHHPDDPLFLSALDEGPFHRAGASTMGDMVALFVPLAALLLGFASFAADRESGRLRMMIGAGGPLPRIAGLRFAIRLALLAMATGLPMLAVGLIVGGAIMQLLAMLLAALAYGAIFLAIGMAVSLSAPGSRAALALLLALWVMLCVLVPRLTTAAVETALPTPSHTALLDEAAAINRAYNTPEAAAARKQQLMAQGGHMDVGGAMLYSRDHHDNAAYDASLARMTTRLRQQDGWLTMAGLASPLLPFQLASDTLAHSSASDQAAFLQAAEAYRRRMSDLMNLDLRAHPVAAGQSYRAGPALFAALPPFTVPQASMIGLLWPLALLALWLIASLLFLRATIRRLRP